MGLFSEVKQRAPACADHQHKTSYHLLAETATLHIRIVIVDPIAGQSKRENSPAYLRQSKSQAPTSLFHDYSFQARREKVSPLYRGNAYQSGIDTRIARKLHTLTS
jgi:hypothetical protein